MQKRLLLFDIDGTLIHSGGAGVRALIVALKERYGIDDDLHDIEIAGMTDSGIVVSILEKHKIPATNENITAFLDSYAHFLSRELPRRKGKLLPGVVELLEKLRSRAKEKHGREFSAAEIDVIGDTPRDIACGKALGARTIAVATGRWSREELAKHRPDFLIDDFSDVDGLIDTLGW
jgi:phosphoglycolate phosphatase